MTKIILDMKLT